MTDLRQLSERFVAAFNRHDLDAIDELTHQDVELIDPSKTVRGRSAARQYTKEWFDAFPDAKITVVNRIVGADCVVTEAIMEGTNTGTLKTPMGDLPATGKHVKGPYCDVTRIKDGLAIYGRLYYDQVDLLTQLGLMPAPAAATA